MDSVTCLLIEEGFARTIPYCLPVSREWWLQLFSGTVGAIIGAVVAAVAAIWVLNRTNKKQQELWDASSAAQAARDRDARTESQQALRTQLEAQQAGIDRSFRRQAELASEARVRDALANVVTHVHAVTTHAGVAPKEMERASASATQAINRLRLDLTGRNQALAAALHHFCERFYFDNYAVGKFFEAVDKDDLQSTDSKFIFNQRKSVAEQRDRFTSLVADWLSSKETRPHTTALIVSCCTNEVFSRIAAHGLVDLSSAKSFIEEKFGEL